MFKSSLIGLIIGTLGVSTYLYFLKSNHHSVNGSTNSAYLDTAQKQPINNESSNLSLSNGDAVAPDKENEKCYSVEEYRTLPHFLQLEHFFRANIVDPSFIEQSLLILNEQELISLIDNTGDASAMYVLGMNYLWFSFHETFLHPLLSQDMATNRSHKLKKLDEGILGKARHWLWKASVHGVPIAMPGYADTYLIQKRYCANLDDETLKTLSLQVEIFNEVSMRISPDYSFVTGINIADLGKDNVDFKNDEVTKAIMKWQENRRQIGLSPVIEFQNLDLYKKLKEIDDSICITQVHSK